jgi:hypothetical protein
MNLITLQDAAKKHNIKPCTLVCRLRRAAIKPVAKQGRFCMYDYEDLKPVLHPVEEDFQASRIETLKQNKAGIEQLKKVSELEFFDNAQIDIKQFALSEQAQKNRAVIASLSVYG